MSLRRLYEILDAPPTGPVARCTQGGIQLLILANVAAVGADSVPEIHSQAGGFLRAFELISVGVFTIEYLLRLLVCTESDRFRRPLAGRIRYAATPLALIDLLAILPAYLPFFGAFDLRVLRILRMLRVFRVLKLGRYSEAVRGIGLALRDSSAQIGTVIFGLAILLVLAASLVFYAEHSAQPEAFRSIPATAWWAIVTLTTVGYGDMAPVTAIGKLVAGLVAVLGIGLFALPAGILGSAFLARVQGPRICPHCGREV